MKNRLLSLLILAAIALLINLFIRQTSAEPENGYHCPSYSWSEMRAIFLRERDLEAECEGLLVFQNKLTQLKAELLTSSISLANAAEQLTAVAREHNPRFLASLNSRYPDLPTTSSVAFILVEHLLQKGCDKQLSDQQNEVVEWLQCELSQMPGMDGEFVDHLLESPKVLSSSNP